MTRGGGGRLLKTNRIGDGLSIKRREVSPEVVVDTSHHLLETHKFNISSSICCLWFIVVDTLDQTGITRQPPLPSL